MRAKWDGSNEDTDPLEWINIVIKGRGSVGMDFFCLSYPLFLYFSHRPLPEWLLLVLDPLNLYL